MSLFNYTYNERRRDSKSTAIDFRLGSLLSCTWAGLEQFAKHFVLGLEIMVHVLQRLACQFLTTLAC